ncbi:hypothetical protein FACS1894191_3090 [Clostridia bacterium]|nr:hypothetical protein FACS1894191_3090 [Clostridia bacterium]
MKKQTYRLSFATIAAVIAVVFVTTSAFAAWHLLRPGDIAEKKGDYALSAAFDSETAININQSKTSGDYIFTLMAVVSGKDITDTPIYTNDVRSDSTYAVIAIQKADGTPMPGTQDTEYGEIRFFASPLVRGLKPWQVNAATLNGGYFETIVDGVMYRIVDCDNVSVFADRGLYFGIVESMFISGDSFILNEKTGEITANPNFAGASVIFDLPIDKALANPVKAQQYLDELLGDSDDVDDADVVIGDGVFEASGNADNIDAGADKAHGGEIAFTDDVHDFGSIDWDRAIPISSTIKQLSVNANGVIAYSINYEKYGGIVKASALFDKCFVDNGTAQSKIVSYNAHNDTMIYGVRFSMDKNGVITGMLVVPET